MLRKAEDRLYHDRTFTPFSATNIRQLLQGTADQKRTEKNSAAKNVLNKAKQTYCPCFLMAAFHTCSYSFAECSYFSAVLSLYVCWNLNPRILSTFHSFIVHPSSRAPSAWFVCFHWRRMSLWAPALSPPHLISMYVPSSSPPPTTTEAAGTGSLNKTALDGHM